MIRNKLTNTNPPVIHAPDENRIWQQLCDDFFESSPLISKPEDRLAILTWNNLESSPLERCLQRRKIPFVVKGKEILVWNNLQKFVLNLEVCESVDTPILMGLDAHDVLVLGDLQYIVDQFLSINCELLFNCEAYFYPDLDIPYYKQNKEFQANIGTGRYRYLNSGAWIGKRSFCKRFFTECSQIRVWELFDCTNNLKLFNCDQSVVHSVFRKYYPEVRLDYGCRIFNNIANVSEDEVELF